MRYKKKEKNCLLVINRTVNSMISHAHWYTRRVIVAINLSIVSMNEIDNRMPSIKIGANK